MGRKRKNPRHVLFWIKSNRGTDNKAIFKIPNDWSKEGIESALEEWCSRFGAWTHSDNEVNYGWKPVKVFGKRELEKRYDAVCKSKARIVEKWKILAAMFNIRKLD
ncbi:hypothetical protein KKA27_01435 [Patescibacteria group bacterium]|nr:hypothetical protein [Patescibacteria group bacterium]MBU2633156.1 hypothetical protein [Patescibacteria group bacterium]